VCTTGIGGVGRGLYQPPDAAALDEAAAAEPPPALAALPELAAAPPSPAAAALDDAAAWATAEPTIARKTVKTAITFMIPDGVKRGAEKKLILAPN
jgi:hypothetical protein